MDVNFKYKMPVLFFCFMKYVFCKGPDYISQAEKVVHFIQTTFLVHLCMKQLSATHQFQEAKGKLATKHYTDGGDEPGAKRKAGAKAEPLMSLPSHFRPADLSKTVKVLYCALMD